MNNKRTVSQVYNPNNQITKYGTVYQRRPFKRVRVQGGGLVPYGPTRMVIQRPIGARGVTKGMDTVLTSANISTDMSTSVHVLPVNLIRSGTGSWNRVGRVCNMKSLRLRLKATQNWGASTAALQAVNYRILVVYDSQPNGALPTKTEILQYKDQAGTEAGVWDGFMAYDNMQRFTILRDETCTINPDWSIAAAGPNNYKSKYHDIFIKLNHATSFKAESTPMTIADISTGALYVMYTCDIPAPGNAVTRGSFGIEGQGRLRYIDQ